jgi:hypothetical protein
MVLVLDVLRSIFLGEFPLIKGKKKRENTLMHGSNGPNTVEPNRLHSLQLMAIIVRNQRFQ